MQNGGRINFPPRKLNLFAFPPSKRGEINLFLLFPRFGLFTSPKKRVVWFDLHGWFLGNPQILSVIVFVKVAMDLRYIMLSALHLPQNTNSGFALLYFEMVYLWHDSFDVCRIMRDLQTFRLIIWHGW